MTYLSSSQFGMSNGTLTRGFTLVDVFGDGPFRGNPVAVVLDGRDLDVATMQQIANWNNLSETTSCCRQQPPALTTKYKEKYLARNRSCRSRAIRRSAAHTRL